MSSFGGRLAHAWNAFRAPAINDNYAQISVSYGSPGSRPLGGIGADRGIVTTIYNKIALDVASVEIRHIRVSQNELYDSDMETLLNDCLTTQANIDQSARAFLQSACLSLFEDGVIAIVPVETTDNPVNSNAYDVKSLRIGRIESWYTNSVSVSIYNEWTGTHESVTLPKSMIAIVENPLYEIMNRENSTVSRLVHKLSLLDQMDDKASSGKLDLIIQLPYVIKSEERQKQAERRMESIVKQMKDNPYGLVYTDGTEKITQLNRPAENNLLEQIKYLTSQLYARLGIAEDVFNGTASEEVMALYYSRTVEPVVAAIAAEMNRKFLSKTARTQGQRIVPIMNPFRGLSTTKLVEVLTLLKREEIISSNEVRSTIGLPPVDDPAADELRNANINPQNRVGGAPLKDGSPTELIESGQNGT